MWCTASKGSVLESRRAMQRLIPGAEMFLRVTFPENVRRWSVVAKVTRAESGHKPVTGDVREANFGGRSSRVNAVMGMNISQEGCSALVCPKLPEDAFGVDWEDFVPGRLTP